MKVGVLASGAGTNLQALLDRVHGREGIEVVAVGSRPAGRAGAGARARAPASDRRVPAGSTPTARRATPRWPTGSSAHGVELVVLAGYMALLDAGLPRSLPATA